jgi:putative oxidoreductase
MQALKNFSNKADNLAPVLARVLISLVFIYAAWFKLANFAVFTQQLGTLPIFSGLIWVLLALAFELGGAVLLLVGYKTRQAAWALIIFTIMATIIGHANWTTMQFDWLGILKNLTIIGGLLLAAKHGSEVYSLDKKMSQSSVTSTMGA